MNKIKYTIVNLNFLGDKKLPRIVPEDIIGNDNITLRFTDQGLYDEAINNPDLMQNFIIGPDHKTCDCICGCTRIAVPDSDLCSLCGPSIHGESKSKPKPKGPPNDVISQLFPLTDLIVQIMQDLKGMLKCK